MKRIKRIFDLILNTNLVKTLYFNLKIFGIKGMGFPMIIYRRTEVHLKKNSVQFTCKPTFGIIRIGMTCFNIYTKKKDFTKFSIDGHVQFCGRAYFYSGCRIVVQENGYLKIGNTFEIGSQSSIIATQNITLGDNVMISWDSLIMDSDLHKIYNNEGEITNKHRDVHIGNNVWIGCRCCLLKGVTIPDGNVVSAGSFITKAYDVKNSIISSDRIIKSDIVWEGKLYK